MLNRKALLLALLYIKKKKLQKTKRRYWVHPIYGDRLRKGIFHTLHAKLLQHPDKFFIYYRMSVTSFKDLLKLIGSSICKEDTNKRLAICPEERLSVTLRYLATGSSFKALSFQYLIAPSTISTIVRNTCEEIWNKLQPLFMPQKTADDWISVADEFYCRTQFPNVIGAVDGKHVRIICPNSSGSAFYNYKKFFSCVLMAWTDADYKFIFIDVGAYGSSSDSQIFKDSMIGKRLQRNQLNIPRGRQLPNNDLGRILPFYVLGDEAFGLSEHILRPYAKRNLTYNKRIFNYGHSRARRLVECTFGILTNKWHIFHRPLDLNIDFNVCIIKTCCILHNYVRIKDGVRFTDTLYEHSLEDYATNDVTRGRHLTNGTNVRQYLTSYFISPQGSIPWQYNKV